MKLIRLFLLSSLACLAFAGVAAAAESPAASSSTSAPAAPISTTSSAAGTLTTYPEGVQVFTPAVPNGVSECPSQYFCLWENINYGGTRVQFHDSGYWQSLAPYGFVGKASSFYNNRANSSYISETTGGTGAQRCHSPGGAGNYGSDWRSFRAVNNSHWNSG